MKNSINLEYKTDVGKIKMSTNVIVNAYKLLFLDRDSKYYIPKDQEECDKYTIFSAIASVITNDTKDILNKFEKSLMINKLFEV